MIDQDILRHLRFGGKLIGICGGYQMLGQTINDREGFEGKPEQCQGLKLLNIYTDFTPQKKLTNQQGSLRLQRHAVDVKGYEIHLGETRVNEYQPIQYSDGTQEGALSECNQIFGTYLHGLFDDPEALRLICDWAGAEQVKIQSHEQMQQQSIDRIADAIEEHLDLTSLWPTLFKK